MPHAAVGYSYLAEPRAAGEAAALDALVACEGAHWLVVFASSFHAAQFDQVAAGVKGLAGYYVSVTGCAGAAVGTAQGVVSDRPAVAVLAIAGDDFLLRPGQRSRGPAEARLLVLEMGAPRDCHVVVLFSGPEAGSPEALAHEISDLTRLPVYGVTLGEPAVTTIDREVEPGGTLSWLLTGPWALEPAIAPAFEAAPGDWAFGLYLGAVDADPAGDWAAIRTRFPTVPIAGVVGASLLSPTSILLLASR